MNKIKVILDPGAFLPTRAYDTDVGMDLMCRDDAVLIYGGSSAVIDTGVHMEIPEGYCGRIESKSGLNFDYSIVACGGVIDSGYTGSIKVKVYNLGRSWFRFFKGDKIAQIIIQPCVLCDTEVVEKLRETDRGDNGFGSTGK